jgi:hypothetical protein
MQNVSCPDETLTKVEFCRKNLVKLFSIKFYENPPSDSSVITSVQTDRHYEVSSSVSWIFCYGRAARARLWNIYIYIYIYIYI